MKYKKSLAMLIVLPILLSGGSALAAQHTSYYSYNVPKMNGHSTTKAVFKTADNNAVNNNTTNGGGTTLKSWVNTASSDKPVTNTYGFGDGQRISMPYNGQPESYMGQKYRMLIGSGWTDIHNIHTSGYWSPDDK